jgi:hypothetical protein
MDPFANNPFWVPIMLRVNRSLGPRRHDSRPLATEIAVPLAVWVILFEGVFPRMNVFEGRAVADPVDVLCYALGAFLAASIWSWTYWEPAATRRLSNAP